MTGTRPVCLAISSFRNDREVELLLERASQPDLRTIFSRVIVVDSLGTGVVPKLLSERGWSWVCYESSPTNLGSAGNLARRLQIAAASGCEWCYTVNHDGVLDARVVRELIEFAYSKPRAGAVYPLRRLSSRGGGFDITGTRWLPLPGKSVATLPSVREVRVSWYSSNPALYNIEPIRAGLSPWDDLWMGWEDLGYGWLLGSRGYDQFVLTTAQVDDNYEYRRVRVLGRDLHIHNKPAWYTYYHIRNLILVTRRSHQPKVTYGVIAGRLLQEVALTTLFRPNKARRYRLVARGLLDGLRNKRGKAPGLP